MSEAPAVVVKQWTGSMFAASDDGADGHADICYTAYPKTTFNCGKCGINLPENHGATRIRCAKGHLNDLVGWSGQRTSGLSS